MQKKRQSTKKSKIFLLLTAWLLMVVFYHHYKPLPAGLDYESPWYAVSDKDITFLPDLTYIDSQGELTRDHTIFNTVFSHIDQANQFIVADYFLFNSFEGDFTPYRLVTQEMAQKFIDKKKTTPDMDIVFITDPFNEIYGTHETKELKAMRQSDIHVINTVHKPLRDSNPVYSAFWRTFIQWFGVGKTKTMNHPFIPNTKVSLRSYLMMLNFKANHRKTFVADSEHGLSTIVTSANAHDGSSGHSNVGILIHGPFGREVIRSEQAIAKMSGSPFDISVPEVSPTTGDIQVKLITEKAIKRSILKEIKSAKKGDHIHLAMFYLSDRDVIEALIKAAKRDVSVSLVLDLNRDSFGNIKNGIPNRQVAHELIKGSKGKIQVRWYETHGEQYHAKMMYIQKAGGKDVLIIGSANYTKRNLHNYNAETNVLVYMPQDAQLAKDLQAYLRKVWNNEDGNHYTTPYEDFEDFSVWKTIKYRFGEYTGLSTF